MRRRSLLISLFLSANLACAFSYSLSLDSILLWLAHMIIFMIMYAYAYEKRMYILGTYYDLDNDPYCMRECAALGSLFAFIALAWLAFS